jgi:hypothetical protein
VRRSRCEPAHGTTAGWVPSPASAAWTASNRLLPGEQPSWNVDLDDTQLLLWTRE